MTCIVYAEMNAVAKDANAKFKTSMIRLVIPAHFKVKQQGTVITVLQFPCRELSDHARDTAKIAEVVPAIPWVGQLYTCVYDVHGAISLSSASKSFSTNLLSKSKLASARLTAS